ncbi:MAG: hypothetical protein KF817_10580 [Phycisphaeraceae bacterium]|nr:hypothetical protein [Phycisphaeraceae bacterium]
MSRRPVDDGAVARGRQGGRSMTALAALFVLGSGGPWGLPGGHASPAAPSAPMSVSTVERRGGAPPLVGAIERIDDAGVRLVPDGPIGAPVEPAIVVPWDRVRAIRGPRERDPEWIARRAMAEDLWRARTRLERGDHVLAEPLFERWERVLRSTTGESALVVQEGLLRCRLARGDLAGAVVPALESSRLRGAGFAVEAYRALPVVIDERTGLAPQAAPFFTSRAAAMRLARDLAAYDPQGDPEAAERARLYLAAVRRQLGDGGPVTLAGPPPRGRAERIPALFARIVDSMAPPDPDGSRPAAVAGAVAALETISADPAQPAWARAWADAAVGRARLLDADPQTRERGILALLRVPARHAADQPVLAGICVAWARDALSALGAAPAADVLSTELQRRFPGHPVRSDLTLPLPVSTPGTTARDGATP